MKTRYIVGAKFSRRMTIQVRTNNIFCNLTNLRSNKTILVGSAGTYRIRVSKKRLKHSAIRIFKIFLKRARPLLTKQGIIVILVCPIRLRKNFLHLITKFRILRYKNKKYMRALIVKLSDKKSFNGCRPPKKRRKKRKGLRVTY